MGGERNFADSQLGALKSFTVEVCRCSVSRLGASPCRYPEIRAALRMLSGVRSSF